MKENRKKAALVLKGTGVLLALVLLGGLVFVYAVLPGKVAESLYRLSKERKPLTQNPAQAGLSYRDVVFQNEAGISLSGWWLPSALQKPLGTIVLTHGAFRNREQVLTRAIFLVRLGYQVLMFDFRGEGLSGESPLSGGVSESGDYTAAARFLKKEKLLQPPLVFFGFSMGAICALRASAANPEAEAVIADSPLANIRSYVSRRSKGGAFAVLPGFLGRCLSAYDKLSGLSLEEKDLDLMPVVQGIKKTPVLYITGEKDDLALSEEVRKLFEKTPVLHKRLVYIQDAGHEETYSKLPKIYEKIVSGFLEDLRAGFPEPGDNKPVPLTVSRKK